MTASQRNYLTTIYQLCKEQSRVLSVDIATRMEVTRASVCKALRKLVEQGLVVADYQKQVALTPLGKKEVAEVLTEERIIEHFLQKSLALTEQKAKECAELLAPLLEGDTLTRMNEYLTPPGCLLKHPPCLATLFPSGFPQK